MPHSSIQQPQTVNMTPTATPVASTAQPAPSVWQQQQDLAAKKVGNLQEQANIAQQGVGTLENAQNQSLQRAAFQSQQAIGASRGLLGGGRGLATLRQAAQERAATEAGIRASSAAGLQAQRQAAVGAQGEAYDEQAKMLQAAAGRTGAIAQAVAQAKADIKAAMDAQTFFWTTGDAQRAAQALRDKYIGANPGNVDPEIVNQIGKLANQIERGDISNTKELGV